MMLSDLCEEFVGSEGEAWDAVAVLRFVQLALIGFLEGNEAPHQVIDENHWKSDVWVNRTYIRACNWQSMPGRLMRRSQERIKRVLSGSVPPDRITVQNAWENSEAWVTAVIPRKPCHQVPTPPLLPAIKG